MSDTFRILAGFLERFGEEAEGRALQEPPDEVKGRLREFARGSLPASEHPGVLEMLSRNPQWVAWFAGEVKALRPGNQPQ
jgi:hypothetical protein